MNNRIVIFGLMLLMVTTVFPQGKLNAYKYIITPKQFDFQKSEDSYEINSLTKFLFEKQGFVVLYNNESYPSDLRENPCLALNTRLINNSNMFKTKVRFELKNCNNQVVLQTQEGESREKDFKRGFHEAIRNAFNDVENEVYSFSQKSILKEEPVVIEKVIISEVKQPVEREMVATEEIIIEKPQVTEPKYQDKVPVIAEISKMKQAITVEGVFHSDNQTLSIKKQGNQYVVSDGKNNVIGILYPTSKANYFIVKWLQSEDNLSKLVFLNEDGNLSVDDKETVMLFKRKSL